MRNTDEKAEIQKEETQLREECEEGMKRMQSEQRDYKRNWKHNKATESKTSPWNEGGGQTGVSQEAQDANT